MNVTYIMICYLSFSLEPEIGRAVYFLIYSHSNFTEADLITGIRDSLYAGKQLIGTNYISNAGDWQQFGYISHIDHLNRICIIASCPIHPQ